jgi:alpha-D-ribose 1-methylphosphonate 5-triphosphate synthase subunit PhnG
MNAVHAHRRDWLSCLAKAGHDRLIAFAAPYAGTGHEILRPAEIGTVMVRGRIGATGAPFNLGEMTVTRCSLRLASGEVGHGHVQGRSKEAARLAALVDALMQTSAAPEVRAAVLVPLMHDHDHARSSRAAKAAATKVEFFTMVRGED